MRHNINKITVFMACMLLAVCVGRYVFAQSQIGADLLYFPDPTKKISMDFKSASLRDILKSFSILSGLNFVATDSVQDRQISLYLDQVPIRDAMDKIFKANNLAYEMEEDSNIFIVKEMGRPTIEVISRTYVLKNAIVSNSNLATAISTGLSDDGTSKIMNAVENVLSENGSVSEDGRTNSLIVTDVPSRFPLIEQVINSLDTSQPQILIEVQMLDVKKEIADYIGVDWGDGYGFAMTGASLAQGTEFPLGTMFPGKRNASDGPPWITPGTAGFSNLEATMQFITTHTDTKFLARPKILTLNNHSAEIKIVTDEAIGKTVSTSTEESGATSSAEEAERAETGISLRVTPSANMLTREITLYLEPAVKEANLSNITIVTDAGSQRVQDPEERYTKSVLKVKDGETIVVGGMIKHYERVQVKKVPILGDIPFIGAAFRHKTNEPEDRELIVFITPRIVDDTLKANAKLSSANYPALPVREQQSFYVKRNTVIDKALTRYEEDY